MPGKHNGSISKGVMGTEISIPENADTRALARLSVTWTAKQQPDPEADAAELIDMLGLYISEGDIRAGYGRTPCVVDGEVRTKHRRPLPPGKEVKKKVR